MKVRIAYTVEVDDETRRLINLHYGRPGLATRIEVRNFYWSQGEDNGNQILGDLEEGEVEYRTKTGRILTESDIYDLAAEAERGYDIEP